MLVFQHSGVKFVSTSLIALAVIGLFSACNTLATRRSEYAPQKPKGIYTDALNDGSWKTGTIRSTPTPAPSKTP